MKKSFLRRVVAAAVAVPVALTQTVLCASFAADTTAAEDAAKDAITMETFMNVPVDAPITTDENGNYVQESIWNNQMDSVAGSLAGTSHDLDTAALAAAVSGDAWYADVLKNAIASGTAKADVTLDEVTITANVNYDYAKDVASVLSEKAGQEITLAAEPVTGTLVVSATIADLADSKTVPFSAALTVDGQSMDAAALADYAQAKLDALKASAALNDVDAATAAKLADYFAAAQAKLDAAKEKANSWMTEGRSWSKSADSVDEVLAAANEKNANIPASVDEAVANATVAGVFAEAMKQVTAIAAQGAYVVDIELDDVAIAAKTLSAVEAEATIGNGAASASVTAEAPDVLTADELEVLYTYFNEIEAENGKEVDEITTYKVVEAAADATAATLEGTVYFNVKRIITYTVKEVEETTTTEETTTAEEETTTTEETTTEETTTEETTTEETTTTEEETTTTVTSETTLTVETQPAGFYFSHDEEAFDVAELVASANIVVTYTDGTNTWDEPGTVDMSLFSFGTTADGATEGLTPAQVYEETGTAYADVDLYVYYDGALVEGVTAKAYIGVKGDANLNGETDANDSTYVLLYAAAHGAGGTDPLYSAEDETLEYLAYFLADVTGESKDYGADGSDLDSNDSTYILMFAADRGANPDKTIATTWGEVLGTN